MTSSTTALSRVRGWRTAARNLGSSNLLLGTPLPSTGNREQSFQFHPSLSLSKAVKSSLKSYLRTGTPGKGEMKKAMDVWAYWEQQLSVHPELAECALSVLSMPTFSASVERSFKEARRVGFNRERARLDGDKAGKLHAIYFNRNLTFERNPKYWDAHQ